MPPQGLIDELLSSSQPSPAYRQGFKFAGRVSKLLLESWMTMWFWWKQVRMYMAAANTITRLACLTQSIDKGLLSHVPESQFRKSPAMTSIHFNRLKIYYEIGLAMANEPRIFQDHPRHTASTCWCSRFPLHWCGEQQVPLVPYDPSLQLWVYLTFRLRYQ